MVEKLITIEVAYAKPEQQVIISLEMPEDTTVEQTIKASGILEQFPEIDTSDLKVGIFGNVCKLERLIREGDRIEVYRPLIHDPKDARRERASKR
jgi:putative ubiquitin-RnfH superfamily antitoxin RatB of RatAB toxin-antitoxin module